MAPAAGFRLAPLGGVMGAEIVGLDLSRPLGGGTFRAVNAAFLEHQVLCFRGQHLSPEGQIAFSRLFGQVIVHDNSRYALRGHEEVLVLSNDIDENGEHIGVVDAGDIWHSDLQFKPRPAKCTILYALKNPSRGGETDFTNQYLAYEELPEATKARIGGLRGVNSISKLKNPRAPISGERKGAREFYVRQERENPDVEHPLARVHPETGRVSLYCSPRFTYRLAGLDGDEGDALLDELVRHSARHEFRYRHRWRDGDLLMWDNRCVNHRATGGYAYPDIRLIHRTTVLDPR